MNSYLNINFSKSVDFNPENKSGIWMIEQNESPDFEYPEFEIIEFKNGVRDGLYELYQERDLIYKGQYKDGKRVGVWVEYLKDDYARYFRMVNDMEMESVQKCWKDSTVYPEIEF